MLKVIVHIPLIMGDVCIRINFKNMVRDYAGLVKWNFLLSSISMTTLAPGLWLG